MKGSESELCQLQCRVREDSFVCENLHAGLVRHICEKHRMLTIPMVANVLTTIHITAVLALLSVAG